VDAETLDSAEVPDSRHLVSTHVHVTQICSLAPPVRQSQLGREARPPRQFVGAWALDRQHRSKSRRVRSRCPPATIRPTALPKRERPGAKWPGVWAGDATGQHFSIKCTETPRNKMKKRRIYPSFNCSIDGRRHCVLPNFPTRSSDTHMRGAFSSMLQHVV
jgi:hypothetical protein